MEHILYVSSILLSMNSFVLGLDNSYFIRKRQTCERYKYTQTISHKGCDSKEIDNYYCKGQCVSGFIPLLNGNGKATCAGCKASKIKKYIVTLNCQKNQKIDIEVEIYDQCRCLKKKCLTNIILPLEKKPAKPLKKRPCRDVCRKCRKVRRKFDFLLKRKTQMEYLLMSCVTSECKKRIRISKRLMERTKAKKKLKRQQCKLCNKCKRRPKHDLLPS